MDFSQFLDALMGIAYRIALYKSKGSKVDRERGERMSPLGDGAYRSLMASDVEKAYTELMMQSIFPYAIRWPLHRYTIGIDDVNDELKTIVSILYSVVFICITTQNHHA